MSCLLFVAMGKNMCFDGPEVECLYQGIYDERGKFDATPKGQLCSQIKNHALRKNVCRYCKGYRIVLDDVTVFAEPRSRKRRILCRSAWGESEKS